MVTLIDWFYIPAACSRFHVERFSLGYYSYVQVSEWLNNAIGDNLAKIDILFILYIIDILFIFYIIDILMIYFLVSLMSRIEMLIDVTY